MATLSEGVKKAEEKLKKLVFSQKHQNTEKNIPSK